METQDVVRTMRTVEQLDFDPPDLVAVRRDARRETLRRRAPLAVGALVVAASVPVLTVSSLRGGMDQAPTHVTPQTLSPATSGQHGTNVRHHDSSRPRADAGLGEPWPDQVEGQTLSDGEHLDSAIVHTGMTSAAGQEALLFAVLTPRDNGPFPTPAHRDVVVGYRDESGRLLDAAAVISGNFVDDHPWMSFNAFSGGGPGDGWVTYGYVKDSGVADVRITATDGSTIQATMSRRDDVLPGARLFWARGSGLRPDHFALLDANGAVVDECDYFQCPQ